MSFGSNVQPRRIVKPKPEKWECELCDKTIKAYHSSCPSCGNTRPE